MKPAAWAVLLATAACSRPLATAAVEPVTLADEDAASSPAGAGDAADTVDAAAGADAVDAALPPDGAPLPDGAMSAANVGGGLWVVDATGQPIGVVIARGFPTPTSGTALDPLRDGVLVYSPKAGVFFGLQMSSGKVIAPRLGVTDTTCTGVAVAGYYGDGEFISGQSYAFVYEGLWYRIAAYKPAQLVSCGGTVPDGVDGKCAPHAGSCRGFPVQLFTPPLPATFAAPMAFSWLSK